MRPCNFVLFRPTWNFLSPLSCCQFAAPTKRPAIQAGLASHDLFLVAVKCVPGSASEIEVEPSPADTDAPSIVIRAVASVVLPVFQPVVVGIML